MDNHCAMCGDYLADTSRIICEKCEKGDRRPLTIDFFTDLAEVMKKHGVKRITPAWNECDSDRCCIGISDDGRLEMMGMAIEMNKRGAVSPCENCKRVKEPAACANKACPSWQKWFLQQWTRIHNYGEKHKA